MPCIIQCSGTKSNCFVVWIAWYVPYGVRVSAHILFSLVPEEAIFWMRSWPSSVFSSPRVLVSSSLFLDHSWPALIFAEDCNNVSYPFVESSIAVGCWWGWFGAAGKGLPQPNRRPELRRNSRSES